MGIQILLVSIFAVNLLAEWVAFLTKRGKWYLLPGGLIFVSLPLLGVFFDQPRFELDYFWWRIAGVVLILMGIGLLFWARTALGKIMVGPGEAPEKLPTLGPYRYLRHPIYLGLIFIYVGWWWVWAAVYAFYFGMFILGMTWIEGYLEEKLILEKKFGEKFREFRQQTGMFWIK